MKHEIETIVKNTNDKAQIRRLLDILFDECEIEDYIIEIKSVFSSPVCDIICICVAWYDENGVNLFLESKTVV